MRYCGTKLFIMHFITTSIWILYSFLVVDVKIFVMTFNQIHKNSLNMYSSKAIFSTKEVFVTSQAAFNLKSQSTIAASALPLKATEEHCHCYCAWYSACFCFSSFVLTQCCPTSSSSIVSGTKSSPPG